MSCPDDATITSFVGGALPAEQAAAIGAHLDGCASCRQLVAQLMQSSGTSATGPTHAGDSADLPPGTVFSDKYQIVRRIGSGGMGAVYEVLHQATQGRYALKVMATRLVDRQEMRQRFLQEAQLTARIESDHIVRVFDAGVDDATGMPFIAMELLAGEDLFAMLQRQGRLPPVAALGLLHQAALALDKTHAAGVIHRDLKPHNLFIARRDDGQPWLKILDFGIAKLVNVGGAGQQTRSAGTPIYMPPEQIRGEGDIGPAADTYALAHIAYTMLVGHAYWETEAAQLGLSPFITRVLEGPPEPASVRAARAGVTLPAGFDAWFSRAASTSRDRILPATRAVEELAYVFGLSLSSVAASSLPTPMPPAVFAPTTVGGATTGAVVSPAAPPEKAGRGWIWAVVGALVLLLGGGFVALRLASDDDTSDRTSAKKDSDEEKKSKKKKKKKKKKSEQKQTEAEPKEIPPCPLETCAAHAVDREQPVEANDHAAAALALAKKMEPGSELVMMRAKGLVNGKFPEGTTVSVAYMYRFNKPTKKRGKHPGLVILAQEAQLMGQHKAIPVLMRPVPVPKCTMQQALEAAVQAGLDRSARTTLNYWNLTGVARWEVSQADAAFHVDGATCKAAKTRKRKKR